MVHPKIERVSWLKSARTGYALALDTPILTVNGWSTMGELKVGDVIYDENGNHTNVTFTSEIFTDHDCYQIEFDDGTTVVADGGHRWYVDSRITLRDVAPDRFHYRNKSGVITTEEMFASQVYHRKDEDAPRNRFSIPNAKPLLNDDAELPVDPYWFGLWLGDGNSSGGKITVGKDDIDSIIEMVKYDGYSSYKVVRDERCGNFGIHIKPCVKGKDGFSSELLSLGVLHNKHIPEQYLRSSYRQRLMLLQGLMDSDGTVDKRGYCEFYNTDLGLISGVLELVRSFGIKAYTREKQQTATLPNGTAPLNVKDMHVVSFKGEPSIPVFRLPRKLQRLCSSSSVVRSRMVNSVVKVDPIPVRCISVDSPNSLFLATKALIPTHNTKCLNILQAYHIHYDPCPMLVVQPTVDDAKGYSKDEIQPMLRDVPVLANVVAEAKSRDSSNTIEKKSFAGGTLTLVGANSARGFRRLTVRVVMFDEVDGYPPTAGQEGDQIQLGIKRTETFWNRKIVIGSTPTVENFSRIQKSYDTSSRGVYLVPCPECGHYHELEWKNLKWVDKDPNTAAFACPECGCLIDHKHKRNMVENGYWKGEHWEYRNGEFTFENGFDGHIGFKIWAAYSYSPNSTWSKLVKEFLLVKDDPEKLKTYVNTVMGEVWKDMEGDGIEYEYLYANREDYDTVELSRDIKVLVAGIDVQGNPSSSTGRLEVEILGYGAGEECWAIDHVVIEGDPASRDVWIALDELLEQEWTNEDGAKLHIHKACIDSGGGFTQNVYDYVRPRQAQVWAVKGQSQANKQIIGKPTIIKGVKVYPVGTDTAKDIIYSRLARSTNMDTRMYHWHLGLPTDYFKQLTAERVVTRKKMGVDVRVWMCPHGKRNEVLDCYVYALAALRGSNVNLEAAMPRHQAVVKSNTVQPAHRVRPPRRNRGTFARR